jgi:hypothetical protein
MNEYQRLVLWYLVLPYWYSSLVHDDPSPPLARVLSHLLVRGERMGFFGINPLLLLTGRRLDSLEIASVVVRRLYVNMGLHTEIMLSTSFRIAWLKQVD